MTGIGEIPAWMLNQIITGDARELSRHIPDESVDLIFTDPVYDRMDDYRWLAETAARVLRPDTVCLAFCGIGWIAETITALRAGGLSYKWVMSVYWINNIRMQHQLYSKWSALIWCCKGTPVLRERVQDLRAQPISGSPNHRWSKNSAKDAIGYWARQFTRPGGVVLDPFTGGGTVPAVCKGLGRNYIAFEIDPDTAERARQRVLMTQPPLFVPEAEQMSLDVGGGT